MQLGLGFIKRVTVTNGIKCSNILTISIYEVMSFAEGFGELKRYSQEKRSIKNLDDN